MRCTIPTTTGTWWRRASCSSEKMDHQARKATRVQARASQPSRRTSSPNLRTARFGFHGYMTKLPRGTAESPSLGKYLATAAKQNTTDKGGTLLLTGHTSSY